MKNKQIVIIMALMVVFTMACSLTALAGQAINPGGKSVSKVSALWSDVPKMDGMTKEDINLPLPAQIAAQGFIKNTGNIQGSLDFIAYKTSKAMQDVEDYYTQERMATAGWNNTDAPGCAWIDFSWQRGRGRDLLLCPREPGSNGGAPDHVPGARRQNQADPGVFHPHRVHPPYPNAGGVDSNHDDGFQVAWISGGWVRVCSTTQYCSVFWRSFSSCSGVACGALRSK